MKPHPTNSAQGSFILPNLGTQLNSLLSIGGTIESLAGIEKLAHLKTIQFSLWSDFRDISSLITRLKDSKVSFAL